MVMNDNNPQLERIVAYLDGELSPEESAQVEQLLASDEQFRQQLQGMERTWSALDELPMATVGDDFSRTTMEMVVDAAKQEVEAKTFALPVQQRTWRLALGGAALLSLLLGLLVVRVIVQAPNRRLLNDLPVIQNVDIYTQFRDVEFLQELNRRLAKEEKLTLADNESQRLQDEVNEFHLVSSSDNRDTWLEELPDERQVTLRAKFNRFLDLSDKRRDDLRQLHRQIIAQENSDDLLLTMFRYQHWLNGLPPSEQFEYRELEEKDRAKTVARKMESEIRNRKFQLTEAQLEALHDRVQPQLIRLVREYETRMRDQADNQLIRERRFYEGADPEFRVMLAIRDASKHSPEEVLKLNDLVKEALPAEMGDEYMEMKGHRRGRQLFFWLREIRAIREKQRQQNGDRRWDEIPEEELADYFVEQLDPADKERLLALPRDKMKQKLEEMYRGQLPERDPRGPRRGEGGPLREGPQPGDPRWRNDRRPGPPDGPMRQRRFEDERRGPPPEFGTGERDRRGPPEGPPPPPPE